VKLLEKLTSFNFVNNRPYVHSSTIIDYIWKNVEPFISIDSRQIFLMDIQFREELKSNAKIIIFDTHQDISKINDLSVMCKVYSENLRLYIYLFEEKKSIIVNNIDIDYTIKEEKISDNYSGSCVISGQNSFKLISNIIEANKRIHQLTHLQNKDLKVINLYMKKFPINIFCKSLDEVKILIQNLNISDYKGDNATLNRIKFIDGFASDFEVAFLLKNLNNV
jgi:hypothetical protein